MPVEYCEITGTITPILEAGDTDGARLYIHRVVKAGALIPVIMAPVQAASNTVTFRVPKASTIYISGTVEGFWRDSNGDLYSRDNPKALSVPNAATADLATLVAVASIPSEGLTVKSNNVALANPFGALDFSDAFTLTESPTGELNIDITGAGISSLNLLTGSAQTLVPGSSGDDFAISSSGSAHTFNLPTASATKRGALSSSDWSAFNAKLTQGAADALYAALSHGHSIGSITGLQTALDLSLTQAEADALYSALGHNHNSAYQPLDADLTAIAGLADPNADRLLFWDDSVGSYAHLTLGTNLSITDTTLNAAGGSSGANAALSNLASVAVNAALMPAADNAIALNDNSHRYTNSYFSQGVMVSNMNLNGAGLQGDANQYRFGSGQEMLMAADFMYSWCSTNSWQGSRDLGFKRAGANVFELNNGSTGGGTIRAVPTRANQITGDVNNYNPGGKSHNLFLSSDASRNITGLVFSDASLDGQEHYIWNNGGFDIVLVNESGSSTASNQFLTNTGSNITIPTKGVAVIVYDGTTQKWRAALI
jgi:hypothetical protein